MRFIKIHKFEIYQVIKISLYLLQQRITLTVNLQEKTNVREILAKNF